MINATEWDILRWLLVILLLFIIILTTWSCLVVLIANVSQINWLSCQILGISKQALDFVRDGKSLRPRWKFSNQNIFLTTPPLENGLVQDLLRLKSLWRNKFLITFDEFHGSESLSVYFMIKYILCVLRTDEMLTLNWSHSKLLYMECTFFPLWRWVKNVHLC